MTIIDTPEPTTPKRDLNAFLVAMSVALHRYSVYPSDHPSIGPGVGDVLRRANELLADRATSAFDVARRQLIIDGVATDSNQPVLRRLAEGLHAHHLDAVSLQSGIQVDEIAHTLLLLSTEPQREGQLGLTRDGQVPVWPHLKLHPLTFDGLSLIGDASSTDGSDGTGDTLGTELWLGLARAALSGDAAGHGESVPSEPSEVAEAIDNHPRGEAYEHHVMLDGGGYPAMHYSRKCTFASRLVHVCDVYDALSTRRPCREAWESEKTTKSLEDRSGTEFDPELVSAFVKMLREGGSARTGPHR